MNRRTRARGILTGPRPWHIRTSHRVAVPHAVKPRPGVFGQL